MQLILSEGGVNRIVVYGADGRVDAVLTAGLNSPQGITTDSDENLYVANTGNSNVLVYSKPYGPIARTLADKGEYPADVAVSPRGVVATTSLQSTSGGPGAVRFYADGATTPCATVRASAWLRIYFDAFDATGHLFIDGTSNTGQTLVGEISGGCDATSIATLHVNNHIGFPGGIQIRAGNILIDDQSQGTVFTYAPPAGNSLGSPTSSTKLQGASDPVAIAILKNGQSLWTVDAGLASANQYAYPAGTQLKTIKQGAFLTGVAVNPAPSP